jgi:ABC-type spermidine/putrescine transport system permease subunit I
MSTFQKVLILVSVLAAGCFIPDDLLGGDDDGTTAQLVLPEATPTDGAVV